LLHGKLFPQSNMRIELCRCNNSWRIVNSRISILVDRIYGGPDLVASAVVMFRELAKECAAKSASPWRSRLLTLSSWGQSPSIKF
jgi:hypothetical protein